MNWQEIIQNLIKQFNQSGPKNVTKEYKKDTLKKNEDKNMINESTLLEKISLACSSLYLPEPQDLRNSLTKNPYGKTWKYRSVDELKGITFHQELGWGSIESVAKYHTSQESHLAIGGVESISYTLAIRRNGQIVLCNDLNKATWSQGFKDRVGDENAEFLSIMFEGMFSSPGYPNKSAGEPTDQQMLSSLVLWQLGKNIWNWSESDIYGHYHFGKHVCPGHTIQTIIEAIRINKKAESQLDLSTAKSKQEVLKKLGFYKDIVDGIWGPGSKSALIEYQSKNNLTADGVWGSQTENSIIKNLKVHA